MFVEEISYYERSYCDFNLSYVDYLEQYEPSFYSVYFEKKYCPICKKKIIPNKQHIEKTHSMIYSEFLKEYRPGQYENYLDMQKNKLIVKKLVDLYVNTRYKWIQVENNKYITQNIYEAKKFNKIYRKNLNISMKRIYSLNETDILRHLNGIKTIGVFADKEQSKFIIFDLDLKDLDVLQFLYYSIVNYLGENSCHIVNSGKKGFHIVIFFNKFVHKEYIDSFYEIILKDMENFCSRNELECRGNNHLAVKLPLGLHPETKNYCNFVNVQGKEKEKDYILSIKPINTAVFYQVISKYYGYNVKDYELSDISEDDIEKEEKIINIKKSIKKVKKQKQNYSYSQREFIEEKKINGISEKGTRHKVMFQIAISLRDAKLSQNQAIEYLKEWHSSRCDSSLYSSSMKEIIADIKSTVQNVWRNKRYQLQRAESIKFSKIEIEEIMTVKELPLRRLYFILFSHMKSLMLNDDFYMSYAQMMEMGRKKNRGKLLLQLKELEKIGKLEIISRNKIISFSERLYPDQIKATNQYFLPIFSKFELNIENADYKLNLFEINRDFLELLTKKLFISEDLIKYYTKSQLRKLKKMDISSIKIEEIKNKKIELTILRN